VKHPLLCLLTHRAGIEQNDVRVFGPISPGQRLARAEDAPAATARRPPREFAAVHEPDEPITGLEAAAFAARRLAAALHAELAAAGQGYARLRVEARTEAGDELSRTWRLEGTDAAGAADRVRWQLEGWIAGRSGAAPSGALTRLALTAEETHPAGVGAARLWGEGGAGRERAARAADRAAALLGGTGVYRPVEQGGREPRGRVRLVAWGDEEKPLRPVERPWPGRLPDPAPATVPANPPPADLRDAAGAPVGVDGTLALSAPPAALGAKGIGLASPRRVVAWAGPWAVVERWWAPDGARRAYLQVQLDGEGAGPRPASAVPSAVPAVPAVPPAPALLLACEEGQWTVEGIYD
jgi:protein ImuB